MKRAKHSLTHLRLQSFNMGSLIPIMCQEVLPGDTFRHQVSALLRVTPLVAPVMHPVEVKIHSWFVPMRLIWENWETFIVDPDSGLTVPTWTISSAISNKSVLDLVDHMGVGHDVVASTSGTSQVLNVLPFRAYNRIINEFYYDQDIDTALEMRTDDGPDTTTGWYQVRQVRWPKDYFTTARASAQHGSAETAAVGGGGTTLDINEWRRAMATQRLREHRNRFGDRYRDYLAFLGVPSGDARLDRPEYLGGGKQTISFSEVLSTQASGSGLGDLGGHGIAAVSTRPYRRFFAEHGYVLTLAFTRPAPVYQSLIPKTFLRSTWDDFFQKELEMMGDQAVINEELDYAHATPTGTFGYVPRFDDYRRVQSTAHGDFRSTLGTLDHWHYARDLLGGDPALNSTFLGCSPTDRVYVSGTPDELMGMVRNRVAARRLVRKRGHKR
jgi:hypothetical protein